MELFLIILGMSLVTYIPRLLPVFVMDRFAVPGWAGRWLKSIPYAALGALIFPGILTVEKGLPAAGLVGGLVAVAISWFRMNVMFVIGGSILAVIFTKMLMG